LASEHAVAFAFAFADISMNNVPAANTMDYIGSLLIKTLVGKYQDFMEKDGSLLWLQPHTNGHGPILTNDLLH
jgi:hypothetical protein